MRVQVSPSASTRKQINSQFVMPEGELVIVMVSNGPGELTTWVKPLAEQLHKELHMQPRHFSAKISLRLVLVPCPNATSNEVQAAKKWNHFEKITSASNFWDLLLRPNKYAFWPKQGLVIFLGGDQFWSVLLSARLRYLHVTYAEWKARWPFWNNRILAMSKDVLKSLPIRMKSRCSIVGDLMADLASFSKQEDPLPKGKWVALMPGSKKAKLKIGIPFFLEVAEKISTLIPECNFLVPIAPTTNIEEFIYFSGPSNHISTKYESGIKTIVDYNIYKSRKILITKNGTKIHLQQNHPAYGDLSQCDLAITTIGANTAELGALNIPMIVVVPTQHLEVMEAWDGLIGLAGRIPGLKWCIGVLTTIWRLKNRGFMAWPNISAKRMIVPERIGKVTPTQIAQEAFEWLDSPLRLKGQKEDLQALRGKTGARKNISKEIINLLKTKKYINTSSIK